MESSARAATRWASMLVNTSNSSIPFPVLSRASILRNFIKLRIDASSSVKSSQQG
jgi:hypothetical protein